MRNCSAPYFSQQMNTLMLFNCLSGGGGGGTRFCGYIHPHILCIVYVRRYLWNISDANQGSGIDLFLVHSSGSISHQAVESTCMAVTMCNGDHK